MITLKTRNESKNGFDLEIHIEGDGATVASQLTDIFDKIYEASPKLFETALVISQYTKDHT